MSTTPATPTTPPTRRRFWQRWSRRTKVLLSVAAVVVIIGGAVGAALFEPWRLFTRSSVDEAVPTAAGQQVDAMPSGAVTSEAGPTAAPRVLATGQFVDGEHATSGTASILELADGSRFVRLEGFSTSDGPDVHVWLTDQPAGSSDWGIYDDARSVQLGELTATDGNQNYAIPSEVDLAGLTSVVIWCDRFNVAFGTAAVTL